MKKSLMTLETIQLQTLNITTREDDPEKIAEYPHKDPNIKIDFDVRKFDDELLFIIPIEIKLSWTPKSRTFLKKIDVKLTGVYSFPPDTKEALITKYVPTLCLVNLYSEARGIVSQVTGTCPGGSYFLPLLNMNEVVREKREALAKKNQIAE